MSRFALGFVIGATISAAAVLAFTPESGAESRVGLRERIKAAVAAGQQAAAAREKELWVEFRQRLEDSKREQPKSDDWLSADNYQYNPSSADNENA